MKLVHRKRLVLLLPALPAVAAVLLLPRVATDSSPAAGKASQVTIQTFRHQTSPRHQTATRTFRSLPEVRWRLPLARIGSESPPLSLAATSEYLILVTPDRAVVAIQTATQQVAWRRDRADLGLTPRLVLPGDSETVTILGEPAESPMSIRVETGALRLRWPPMGQQLLQSGCFLRNVSVVSTVDTGPSLFIHDAAGTLLRRRQLPWPEYNQSHPLLRQMLLARDDSGTRCVGALALGDAMTALTDARVLWTANYREPFRPPAVRVQTSRNADGAVTVESQVMERTSAARELTSGNGIAYVAFGGTTEHGGKIIDMYSLDSGAYVGTLRFSQVVRRIAASGKRLYVAVYEGGYPVVQGYDLEHE